MSESVGRGLLGSPRARVRAELSELARNNKTLRRVRSRFIRRLLIRFISGVRISRILATYLALVAVCLAAEWWLGKHMPDTLPSWGTVDLAGFVKDVDSYLIAGQIGILGIVSVAIAVVTLLSQRNDGASATTDVRLYYSESLAYEAVTSGVALALVLCIQLFWPGQFGLHYFQRHVEKLTLLEGRAQTFELALTTVHALWMVLNLLLFYRFIVTTLRFVEPDARKRMRDRFTADTALPDDLSKRLLQALYLTAPQSLIGKEALEAGPAVHFGLGAYFLERATTEIETRFRTPSLLVDVRMRPLGIALRSWHRRVRITQSAEDRPSVGRKMWKGEINVPVSLASECDGATAWVLREGPVALSWWERWLIKWSFVFRPLAATPGSQLTPDDFMEELTDKLIGQIEKSALSGFRFALDELVSYHSFILATQDTVDEQGTPLNLAQIGGAHVFERPDQGWVRLYRRVYFAAVDKISSEAAFIERLGHVAQRLIPSDARNVSAAVVTTLLDVGVYEAVALEDWVTRHTTVEVADGGKAEPRLVLAGSDQRAYERVVINFVGAWESLLQSASIVYKWRESERLSASEQWSAHTRAWPYLRTHLYATAYFFALAVWNEDETGATRYRDMLLRWLTPFYAELQAAYAFHHTEFLSPDICDLAWEQALRAGRAFLQHSFHEATCTNVMGIALRAAHDDVLILSAAVVLSWHVNGGLSTDIGHREASAILQRQLIEGEGSTILTAHVRPAGPFWMALAALIRGALRSWREEHSYSAGLDELVRQLSGMAARRIVPGRIYSTSGSDGVDTLRSFLLAVMGAYFPSGQTDRAAWLDWFVANDEVFKDGDRSVRGVIYDAETLGRLIEGGAANEDFDKALRSLDPTVDCAARRVELKSFLGALSQRLANLRLDRLRAMAVDPAKIERIRGAIREALLTRGPEVVLFHDVEIRRGAAKSAEFRVHTFGEIDKGQLVSPDMSSASVDDLRSITVQIEREYLARSVWHEFFGRQRESCTLDMSASPVDRWRAILDQAPRVGARPTLLVPYVPFAEEISTWMYLRDRPQEFNVERLPDMPSGGGVGYVGTINGVHVYQLNELSDRVILCSGHSLRTITYLPLPDADDVVDIALEEGEDPQKSRFRIRTAQVLDWSTDPILEFTWLPEQSEDS